MAKELFIGKPNNTAKKPSKILVGNSNNIAKEVKSIFVGNSSNKAVKVFPNFPDIYQKCEYILNSNGTEYINTNVKPNSDTRIYLEFELANDNQNKLFGALVTSWTDAYGVTISSNNPRLIYGAFNQSYNSFIIGTASLNTRLKLDFNKPGGYFYLNGTLVYTSTNTFSNTENKGLVLFGWYDSSTIYASTTRMRVYHFQAWQGGVMIRDMYPCYLKSNTQTVGMYDVANGVFYGNSGTGIFYKGPDVN